MENRETETLDRIFIMAARNPEFRNKLFSQPEILLKEFDLSDRSKRIIIDTMRGMLNQ